MQIILSSAPQHQCTSQRFITGLSALISYCRAFLAWAGEETLSHQFPSLTTQALRLINLIHCRHVGEKVRMDLQRKQNLPANKLANLMAKFDEVKNGGNMMPTATLAMGTMEGKRR